MCVRRAECDPSAPNGDARSDSLFGQFGWVMVHSDKCIYSTSKWVCVWHVCEVPMAECSSAKHRPRLRVSVFGAQICWPRGARVEWRCVDIVIASRERAEPCPAKQQRARKCVPCFWHMSHRRRYVDLIHSGVLFVFAVGRQ